MPDIIGKAKDLVGKKEDKAAQPGDKVEGTADNTANQEINQAAGDAGVPQQFDQTIDEGADAKINQEIPGGNN